MNYSHFEMNYSYFEQNYSHFELEKVYIYKHDLAWIKAQGLICHKTQITSRIFTQAYYYYH